MFSNTDKTIYELSSADTTISSSSYRQLQLAPKNLPVDPHGLDRGVAIGSHRQIDREGARAIAHQLFQFGCELFGYENVYPPAAGIESVGNEQGARSSRFRRGRAGNDHPAAIAGPVASLPAVDKTHAGLVARQHAQAAWQGRGFGRGRFAFP